MKLLIISASRRTDIPACYSEWFYNRIKEKYVLVRNPMNIHQVSRINLSPDVIDCIVFWTKNPLPMIKRLDYIKDYNYYFQFTLNSYGNDVEPDVPDKNDIIIPAFQNLSEKIGAEKVIWRYDPIFLSKKYTIDYHVEHFEKIAKRLKGYTQKCTISFIDLYKNTIKNIRDLDLVEINDIDKRKLAQELSKIAFSYGFQMDTCAEDIELGEYGITHAKCIDDRLIENITGYKLNVDKDKNQRKECKCVSSFDIGMYNTCTNGCKYCYANYNSGLVKKNIVEHDPASSLLSGQVTIKDNIKDRNIKSCRECQINMFDIF